MKKIKNVLEEVGSKILETEVSENIEASFGNKHVNVIDRDNLKKIEFVVSEIYAVDVIEDIRHQETNDDGKIAYSNSKTTHYFNKKEDAWMFFKSTFPEMVTACSAYIGWNDEVVEFSINDYNDKTYLLHKWDGFDRDVELGWKVKDDEKVYHSYKELWEAHPAFDGQYMSNDRPWFHAKGSDEVAELVYNSRFEDGQNFRSNSFANSISKEELPF